jgi:putative ABC transport system permease protein
MESMKQRLHRVRALIMRTRIEDGLSDEIRFHIDQQTEKNIRAGMSPDEARRRAFIKFGGVEHVKEQTRDEYRWAFFEDFLRDLRYGARVLRRAKTFAIVSILTLGLGIGAATAVFSVVNGVLLRPLPYSQPDRIVRLFQIGSTGRRNNTVSEPNFEDWKSGTRSFRVMAQMASYPSPVAMSAETTMIPGAVVSREFFEVIGVHPIVGRGFTDDERKVGAARAVIVSYRFWQQRFGGAALGNLSMRISDQVHQVVGVMPPGFDYPNSSEYWLPRELSPPETSRTAHNWQVIARLADHATLAAAQAELSTLSRALKVQYGDATWMSDAVAVPLREQLTATSRPVLWMLFGAAILLLVIACLNVSNLQLARASARRREIAVRRAVGAGSGRITRQLFAEAMVLSTAAAALGVVIATAGVRGLVASQSTGPADGIVGLARLQEVEVDWVVMVFAISVAVMTAVLLGIATAVRASRQEIRDTLSEGTRTMAGGRASERVRQGLVIAQVALTIVLLAGAGLLARSFVHVLAIDPGYRTARAALLDLTWTFSRDSSVQRRRQNAQHELLTRLRTLPGVENVGLISTFPLGPGFFPNGQFIEMTRPDELQSYADSARLGDELKNRVGVAGYRVASDGYFSTMGIRLVRGRLFEETDGPDAPHVAVISESLATTKWPNQDPIGRYIQFGNMDGDMRALRIVGIVTDVREISPETLAGPLFYGYYRQRMASRFSVVVRTAIADGVVPGARQIVRTIDPDLAIQVRTIEEAFDRALSGRRFSLTLIGVFSAAALVLATLGIYGLISYLVAERTREIGIRLALGAESTDVLRLVVGKGATLAVVGITVGLVVALALTQLLKGMLFGVTPTDPIAFGTVMAVTLGAVIVASYVPARRAMRVAPVVALRTE